VRNLISPTSVLLAAALSTAICTGSALAASHPVTASNFVLKRSDVPASFKAKNNNLAPISLTDAVARYGVKAAVLTKEGWVAGYESVLSRQYKGKSTPSGFYGVADDVVQFKSGSGARWLFERMTRGTGGKAPATVPSIGDQTVASDSGTSGRTRVATITFRHGDYVVSVSTTYIGTGDPLPKASHYAKLINHRLTTRSG
jgi:hypothetical protein